MSVVAEATQPRWAGYAEGSSIDYFAWWCETFCIQTVDEWNGLPLELEAFQLDFMGEALAIDENDRPVWGKVALCLPRKNGKTQLLAAYALYSLLEFDGSPEVLLSASSDKQAGRLFDAAVAMARSHPDLRSRVHLRAHIGEIARVDGFGIIKRLSNNGGVLDGYNPSVVVVDELHAWKTPKQRRTWASLLSGGGARKAPQVFTITTAGEAQDREEGILGRMIDGNEAKGDVEKPHDSLSISRDRKSRTLIYNYSAPTLDPTDFATMKRANPASWITPDFLSEQAAGDSLSSSEVLQLHGGVWSDAKDAWVTAVRWDELADEAARELGDTVWVGADGARTNDSTALGFAWRLDDDRIAVSCHVWSALSDSQAHERVAGGHLDNRVLIPYLEKVRSEHTVKEVVYDPHYLQTVADMLDEAGFLIADAWSAGANRAKAWQSFRDAVDAGTIAHAGDTVLRAHVTAARAKNTDMGWKVSKLAQSRKIDALVAIAMAHWRCQVGANVSVWADAW